MQLLTKHINQKDRNQNQPDKAQICWVVVGRVKCRCCQQGIRRSWNGWWLVVAYGHQTKGFEPSTVRTAALCKRLRVDPEVGMATWSGNQKNYPKLRSPQKIGVWPTTDGGLKPAGFMGRIIIEQENLYSINQLEGMGMTDDFVHVPVGNGIRMCWGDKWFQGFFI